ncbi:MAG: hypothetical protein HGGPFJEG_01727 [Ignavibacteria bacterium]|nr:hypothetical protein [Ignavibacteria bacterium]
MNNYFNNLISVFIILFSSIASAGFSQNLYGDGNVVKETKYVDAFEKIELNGIINLFIQQGDIQKVEIEADKNLIPYIEFKSGNNTLDISTRDKAEIKSSTKLKAYITLKNIESIELNSTGNLNTIGKLKLKDIEIESNSIGNIIMDIDCNKLTLECNSIGNVTLTGNADIVDIEQNSIGNVKAFDLKADKLEIENNSTGNSEVYADREFSISLNGTGNITYSGNAIVRKLEKNGIGKVEKND